jgi:hypothetical protein
MRYRLPWQTHTHTHTHTHINTGCLRSNSVVINTSIYSILWCKTFLLTTNCRQTCKIYCYLMQFNVSAHSPTDVVMKFNFTQHPREHIHSHRSDSRCNPSAQIGKRLHHFTAHDVFDTPKRRKVRGCWISTKWRSTNRPSPADPQTRKPFVENSGNKTGLCTNLLENKSFNFRFYL